MFVFCTIAAKRDDSKKFDGSATPDLALVDTEYRDVVWIDAKHPTQWESAILEQLGETWKASENLSDEDIWPNRIEIDLDEFKQMDSLSAGSISEELIEAVMDSINN